MADHRQAIKVYVSLEERERLIERASGCDLPLSAYLRRLGIGHQPKSTIDAQAVLLLLKVNADQGRLGGLLKLWLSDRPGTGAPAFDVRRLLGQIEATQLRLRSLVRRLDERNTASEVQADAVAVSAGTSPALGDAP